MHEFHNLPDVFDRHVKNVNLAQFLALPVAWARVRDFLAKFVEAGVDLSLPLTFAGIGLLAAVPDRTFFLTLRELEKINYKHDFCQSVDSTYLRALVIAAVPVDNFSLTLKELERNDAK